MLDHLTALGPVHVDAVKVGVFLKSDRKIAEVRPRARTVNLMLALPRALDDPRVARTMRGSATRTYNVIKLTGPSDVDDQVRGVADRGVRRRDRLSRAAAREPAQPEAQAVPFSAKDVGDTYVPPCVPWYPNDVLPPGAIVPLYDMFRAVTADPLTLTTAFHALVTVCPAGSAYVSVQPFTVDVPVLVTVTSAVKPVFHAFGR